MGLEIYPCPSGKEEVILQYMHDRHFQYIHPNVFVPARVLNVERMGGGGSGVSVFSGTHPILGEIVMKHGGFSDMKELFALGTISTQLTTRGKQNETSLQAASAMKNMLPEFKMVYISPQHVLYKPKAVWGKLKKLAKIGRESSLESFVSLAKKIEMSERHLKAQKSTSSVGTSGTAPQDLITLNDSKFLGPGASIRIYECDSGNPAFFIENCVVSKRPCLNFVLPKDHIHSIDNLSLAMDCTEHFDSLEYLYKGLSPIISKHLFNFTLAQKRIGGADAKTGSQWFYEGKLDGIVLDTLVTKFIETIRNLQALTLPEEVDVIDQIRNEVEELQQSGTEINADGLSPMADQFMGNAIKKNFHPTKGRIRFLRKTCRGFVDNTFHLEKEEVRPAKHLATLVEPHSLMSDVFVGASSEPPLFHPDNNFWLNLMQQATSTRSCMSPNATKRVWTSGLCDAGIHNLFVSKDDLYFFDLGVPQLQSMPGFMTKFLFSFFHILGMEEDEAKDDGEWVRRFVPADGDATKLELTKETKDLLPKAYDAFEVALERIIEEVFDGDQSLRWLLLEYVTLQLLSDAAFCLQRWQLKGGGQPRRQDNFDQGLEQWLWRALWDIFVAFDINSIEAWERFKVEHPDCSHTATKTELRVSVRRSRESIDGRKLQLELLKLEEMLDQQEVSRNSVDHKTVSRRRSSMVRFSSQQLEISTLRELTSATFQNTHITEEDDEDEDDEDFEVETESYNTEINIRRSSLILPVMPNLHPFEEEGEEGEEA